MYLLRFPLLLSLLFFTFYVEATTYIVHMDSMHMPRVYQHHASWYAATLSSVSSATPIYTYKNAIKGFSAELTDHELQALKSSPGYLHSTPEKPVTRDTTYSPAFLGLNPTTGAWPISEMGKDVIVGVIDTGVWPESRSFRDEGLSGIPSRWKGTCQSGHQFNASMCNNKLIGAQFFTAGLLKSNPNINISMKSPRDTLGHGTHTSSTAAGSKVEDASYFGYAKGMASGIARSARIAVYKVLWEEGESLSDIIAAIDKAMEDGVDVISMSFGFDEDNLYDDVVAIASFAAVEKGIFVSVSAGNDGPLPGSVHNGNPWVLTVAAGSLDRQLGGSVKLGNGVILKGISLFLGNASSKKAVLTVQKCEDGEALGRVPKHMAVVCLDLNGNSSAQISNVKKANVSGGAIFISEDNTQLQTIFPSLILDWKTGGALIEYMQRSKKKPTVTFHFHETHLHTTVAPKVAGYSSRGPSLMCPYVAKPDVMAPGNMILASWPPNIPVEADNSFHGEFNMISGTSMACPHASGVAALLKGAHPDWSVAMIRSAIMTTANPLDHKGGKIKDMGSVDGDQAASALAMGAGHINPNKAMEPGLVYDAGYNDYVNLLCGMNYTMQRIKAITRSSNVNCSSPSLDLNYPSFVVVLPSNAGHVRKVFRRRVTNVGAGAATYVVMVTTVKDVNVSVVPEKLVFQQKHEEANFTVTVSATVPRKMKEPIDASLSWVETNGKFVVRSPIVVTTVKDL